MSGAMAGYPAAARASSWWRQEYQDSGQPWHTKTTGPAPASAKCIRMPLASTNRCEIVIAAPPFRAPDYGLALSVSTVWCWHEAEGPPHKGDFPSWGGTHPSIRLSAIAALYPIWWE